MKRTLFHAVAILPLVVSMVVFSDGFNAWFQQDDFAHLKLAAQTRIADLPGMLVQPIAQGTFRPLSERLFYWLGYQLAGLDPTPFRIVCLIFHTANCLLFYFLLFHLSRSRLAAAAGVTVWAVNPCLTLPLTWIATTNQVLLVSCLLGALCSFVLYCESGRRRFLALSWIIYLVGFGVLESNVAVPAIISLYAILFHNERFRISLIYWLPALLFTALHLTLIPRGGGGTYAIGFGFSILDSAWTYWKWSWLLEPSATPLGIPDWAPAFWAAAMLLFVGLLILNARTRVLVVFAAGWWLAMIGPVLPLGHHVTDYYLTGSLLGCGIIVATALRGVPVAGAALLLTCLCIHVPVSRFYSRTNVERSQNMEALVKGVEQVHYRHPHKTILLASIGDELFWSGVYDKPFSLVGAAATYLTPESASGLTHYPDLFQPANYTIPRDNIALGLEQGQIVIYASNNRRLVNATAAYAAANSGSSGSSVPSRIELANPLFSRFTGSEWYPPEQGFRWMPAAATLRLGGEGDAVHVRGYSVPPQFSGRKTLLVRAEWNGVNLGCQEIAEGTSDFALSFALPKNRSREGVFGLKVDRPIHVAGDSRDLGLAVTTAELK